MSGEELEDPPGPQTSGSNRLRIARAALKAALGVSGVLGADPGSSGLRVTADPPSGVLVGVSVAALPDGRYGVDLSLVAEMVPLPELADEVRTRVLGAVRRERLARVLGSINVEFASVMTREEYTAVVTSAAEAEAARELEAAPALEADPLIEVPEVVAVPAPAPTPAGAERGDDAFHGGRSTGEAAAAIAARQAAIATEQAALAAKQAALAAEQAALAAGSEAMISSPSAAARSTEPDDGGHGT